MHMCMYVCMCVLCDETFCHAFVKKLAREFTLMYVLCMCCMCVYT
jgi:hypothetical protein